MLLLRLLYVFITSSQLMIDVEQLPDKVEIVTYQENTDKLHGLVAAETGCYHMPMRTGLCCIKCLVQIMIIMTVMIIGVREEFYMTVITV